MYVNCYSIFSKENQKQMRMLVSSCLKASYPQNLLDGTSVLPYVCMFLKGKSIKFNHEDSSISVMN